jgi:hypothetical protein
MEIDGKRLYELLEKKGVNHLHHANTVTTAITFIQAGGLLSRGAVEHRNLFQTEQRSDIRDKRFDVWDDIFLDTLDLHGHFPRNNAYGPVMFRFSTELLLTSRWEIWVTRDNPTRWRTNMTGRDKYFSSIKAIRDSWDEHLPERRMITLRHVTRAAMFGYLEEIVLDDPEVEVGDINLHRTALHALRTSVGRSEYRVPIRTRSNHQRNCFCLTNYSDMTTTEQIALFFPLEKVRQK